MVCGFPKNAQEIEISSCQSKACRQCVWCIYCYEQRYCYSEVGLLSGRPKSSASIGSPSLPPRAINFPKWPRYANFLHSGIRRAQKLMQGRYVNSQRTTPISTLLLIFVRSSCDVWQANCRYGTDRASQSTATRTRRPTRMALRSQSTSKPVVE